jgi:hypothetical protein
LPDYKEWSLAAVRLLQGVVYADDEKAWDAVLESRSTLETYFGRLGLRLIVDEPDGLAYLKQAPRDELPVGYEDLPKLFRKSRLSYGATLLCVMLREELRTFEDENVDDERCVIRAGELFEQWKSYFPANSDEVTLRKDLDRALRTLEDLKFVRRLGDNPEEWEIRRILKARVSVADLEALKAQLLAAAEKNDQQPSVKNANE